MLQRNHLQERRRLQLLNKYSHRPAICPHPHPHGLETAGQHANTHWPSHHPKSRPLRIRSRHLQDTYAGQLLQRD